MKLSKAVARNVVVYLNGKVSVNDEFLLRSFRIVGVSIEPQFEDSIRLLSIFDGNFEVAGADEGHGNGSN